MGSQLRAPTTPAASQEYGTDGFEGGHYYAEAQDSRTVVLTNVIEIPEWCQNYSFQNNRREIQG